MAYLPRILLAAAALNALAALAPAQSEPPQPTFSMLGTAAIGSACLIDVVAPQDQGHNYVIMLSMNNGSTPLPGGQSLPIGIDGITFLSLTPGNGLIHGNVAALHRGKGQALLIIPFIPAAIGSRLYAGAMTFDPTGQGSFIRTVMPQALQIDIVAR